MTKLIALAAASLLSSGALQPRSPHYFGATRNLFMGTAPVFDKPDGGGGGGSEKTVEQLADEVRNMLETSQKATLETAEKALTEAQKTGTLSTETKAIADKALAETQSVKTMLAELEQKLARRPGKGGDEVKSYGCQVAESDSYKNAKAAGFRGPMRVELKAITTALSGTNWSERDTEVTGLPKRELYIRDLLNVVPTTAGSVDYAKQTLRTNNAGVVAEGAAKSYSAYEWTKVSAAMRTIAHLAKITRQAMDDSIQLQGEVDSEMRYGLALAEETEILTGDNTGEHLNGLIPNATAYEAPILVNDATMIDVLRLALLQAELALYPTDGIVLNPSDWAGIELTKTTEGAYIFANPMQLAGPRLWGKPVVSTTAMTIDKFLAGGFKLQTLYDRMAPEVLISSENADDFEKNLLTMRCEERVALAPKKPGALIYGDFGNV
jgi:HK97 family phage major capsid protein